MRAPFTVRTGTSLGLVLLTCAAGSCGRSSERQGRDAKGGASTGGRGGSTGGSSTGGKGGASVGGSSTGGAGGISTGGGTTGGAGGNPTGGSSTGGIGGTSIGGESGSSTGGEGGCVDACALYGPACCVGSATCIEPGGRCVIDVLSERVDVIYEYADLEAEIASLPQDVLVSLTDSDIEWAAADPPAAGRFELHLTSGASTLHGTALEGATLHPFRVSCEGQSLFVGVLYLLQGAAAIQTPVLHVERDVMDLVVLKLGAGMGVWAGLNQGSLESRERIDRPELRNVFCQRGALSELAER